MSTPDLFELLNSQTSEEDYAPKDLLNDLLTD